MDAGRLLQCPFLQEAHAVLARRTPILQQLPSPWSPIPFVPENAPMSSMVPQAMSIHGAGVYPGATHPRSRIKTPEVSAMMHPAHMPLH